MVKRVKKNSKRVPRKKVVVERTSNNENRDRILVENFVGLQKAMTHLSIKFENLSDNISKLLNIFELSAKDYMEHKGKTSPEADKEIVARLNMLLEQNKLIAKSIIAVDEKVRSKPEQRMQPTQSFQQPVQQAPSASQYQPSMQNPEFKPKPLQ